MLVRRGVGRIGRPGLIGTMARTAVVAGTATAVAGGMHRRQQAKAVQADQAAAYQQEQAAAATAAEAPPAPTAPATETLDADGAMGELERLAEMRGQGLLSDAEFAAAKAKLLGL